MCLAAGLLPAPAAAQVAPCPPAERDGKPTEPPAGSAPVLRCMEIFAHPVNETVVEHETYTYYIKSPQTIPSQGRWAPFSADLIQADFWNLWRTGFLDNLWVEVIDEPFPNGVVGKHVVFHIEERSRIKNVDYVGSKRVAVSKIEETLRERNVAIRLDSFVDPSAVRRVKGIIRELYAEKGYTDVAIVESIEALPSGPKLANVTFTITEGPKVRIRQVTFDGNQAFSDRRLAGRMKDNKAKNWLSWVTSSGTYLEAKFEDDADLVQEFYVDRGYAQARVGVPQIERVEDSKDGKTRWIRLRIPVDEGRRYRVGEFEIVDNATIKTEFIRPLFKVKEGDWFSMKPIRKGIDKTRELYGTVGFMNWTPDPRMNPRGIDPDTGLPTGPGEPPAILDVRMRMVEGKQFTINRITFLGNTTTHDAVIRRELRFAEGGVMNMEALKDSVRRLNQLGYFKPLEGKEGEIDVQQVAGREGRVDVKLKFEEQNRNQISFGAGISQFDGFFGQLSFQTSNFLGRGETLGISLQKGSLARQYQVSFSEPYLFERPMTLGIDLFARAFAFPFQYTQDSTGGNLVFGFPLADYTRMFTGYSYERVRVYDIASAYLQPGVLEASPFLRASLLIDEGGRRTVSKISPSVVFNTVNQPIFPSAGTRYTAGVDVAGLGGNTYYTQVRFEGIWYKSLTPRMSFGLRAEGQYIRPYGKTTTLPIFEKFFLGGEYSMRGFDIRSVGPRDPVSRVVTGGNKTMLFNAEYYFNVGGPVRVLGFFDAGQVRDLGQRFEWKENIVRPVAPERPLLFDPFALSILSGPGATTPGTTEVIGRTHAFKTSTGVEVRFFMPVLNVPFRLIAAYNPSRNGVFDNNLQPQKKFTFRFAVGTTF
jgi:outer membrane protein insertion porin family